MRNTRCVILRAAATYGAKHLPPLEGEVVER